MNTTFILAGLIGTVYPLYFVLTYRKVNNNIKTDGKFRLADYKNTIFIFWLATGLILLHSFLAGNLSLDFYPHFNTTGIILSTLVAAFIVLQAKQSKITAETAPLLRAKMQDIYPYLPKTQKELRWFSWLSISAGICEEIIFRLFLFTFLLQHTHISIAFVLTNIIFAITHIGSGKQNLLTSFIIGFLFSTIYYFTDNIWIAIILHAAIDINAGIIGYSISQFERLETKIPAQAHVSEGVRGVTEDNTAIEY